MNVNNSPDENLTLIFLQDLEEENKVKYFRALTAVRCEKRISEEGCPLLTYNDIQESIDVVNKKCLHDDEGQVF